VNALLLRVDALRERFQLGRFGLGERMSCVLLTPRFRTSRHVVALLTPNGATEPRLVVKMPRLPGDGEGLAQEARVLTALRERCPQAAGSIPQVVGRSDGDRPLLIETALPGPLVTAAMLRATPSRCVDEVVRWLMGLSSAQRNGGTSFERLIAEPLQFFAESFPEGALERDLVARTLEIVGPLDGAPVPRVFEHGDLCHPNLIWLPTDRVGVVDWELAEEDGFPLHDLSFFLAFATFALRRPREPEEHVAAFHEAFFGGGSWARSRVIAYAEGLELDQAMLTPLFVACWARYTAQLVARIAGGRVGLDDQSAAWVRQNRYYGLWRHTLDNLGELTWGRR
jgi:aminoglycoside phosphotransferase (APT) family kinase protein